MAKDKSGVKPAMSKRERANARRAKKIRQQRLKAAAVIAVIVLVIGGFVALGFVLDWWAYQPKVTYHASIEVENYGSLHVSLYGKDAPETVDAFIELAEHGHYNGKSFGSLLDGNMIACDAGDEITIVGEFEDNGVKNRAPHKRGTLSMLLPDAEDPDSANGSFAILTKDMSELDESRAAFGRVTEGLDILDKMVEDMENGKSPKITSISLHHAH
ncbi:MAG: peptidylprolyl isomerase [Clostridia bacterium]|nr:peptidylprolyl isomerase [Clostridia bacterium]